MDYNGMKLRSGKKFFIFLLAVLMALLTGCAPTVSQTSLVEPTSPALSSKRITDISLSDENGKTVVLIKGSEKLVFTSVKQPFPLGIVLYFPETDIDQACVSPLVESDIISSIETSGPTESGSASKVNILLKQDIPYEVGQMDSDLKIAFGNSEITASPMAEATKTEADEPIEAGRLLSTSDVSFTENNEDAKTHSAEVVHVASSMKPAWMNRIDFSSEEAGKSKIIIGTSRPVEYDMRKISDKRLKVDLFNTNIPVYRQRQLITTRFESAVDRIIPVQTDEMNKNSVISIELRESVPYFVEQSGNIIMINFEASSIPPRPFEIAKLPDWKKIVEEAVVEDEMEEMAEGEEDKAVHATETYFEKKEYTGEKIALDFYETDIKNVFRILREISGKNFVIDDDVNGKVTMTLDKPVPWDQILDLVLKMNQCGVIYEGDIIRIATLKTIKKESEALMESVQAEREAKEKIKNLAPLMTEYIAVSYSNAKTEVLPHLENLVTEDRGTISVDERNNQVIMTDTADKIAQAKEIVKNIDKVTPQVIIEAKVVEISSNASKEIGIEWNAEGGISNDDSLAGIGPQRGFDVIGGTYGWTSAMNFPSSSDSGIGFNFTRIAGTPFVLDARLTALEATGDVEIISAPKVVTLDNKKAMIKQGIEVGYYDREENEEGRDVEFKEVDLLLEVTPHVTPDERVSMSIFITKNDIDQYIDGIPSIATNEATTELLVNDGDTIVIGGIIKNNKTYSESNFPGLSKIPGLGWLFRSKLNTDKNNELLIFITPRIVQLEQRAM